MDLKLLETGNGGDVARKTKDLFVIEGLQNMPYLAMFGGNLQANTPVKRLASEQAFDYWGNSLFSQNDLTTQFNSNTERALNNTPLTSAGRIVIENAVKKDLQFMLPFANVEVSVTIPGMNMVQIYLRISEPNNLQSKEFVYIWDATKSELEVVYDSDNPPVPVVSGFNYFFDFNLA